MKMTSLFLLKTVAAVKRRLLVLFPVLLFLLPTNSSAAPSPVPTFLEIAGVIQIGYGALAKAEQPWSGNQVLQFAAGGFDALRFIDPAPEMGIEYWAKRKIWRFRPIAGAFATGDESIICYTGINHDFILLPGVAVVMDTAVAWYSRGDGKDLGSSALLRSGIGISWIPSKDIRLGLTFHHMSHGKMFSNKNPGVETVNITVGIPLHSQAAR